jgi:hypothetical protein
MVEVQITIREASDNTMHVDVRKKLTEPTPHELIMKKNLETCIRAYHEMLKDDGIPLAMREE